MVAMASYSEGQVHQLVESLEERGFTAAEITTLGQNSGKVLDNLRLVLKGLATIVRSSLKLAMDKPFNPAEFIDSRWAFWKGPANGNGKEGEDDCVQEPDIVDFEQIVLETHLKEGESSISGEEKMKRARAGKNQQLGTKAFLALWNDYQAKKAEGKPEDSILERLRKSGKIGAVIYFFGSTLRAPDGDRRVLSLYFDDGEWYWSCDWLANHWNADDPSVALASVS
jgi:hypothetical protein